MEKRLVTWEMERMSQWFRYDHLPGHLQPISKIFHDAAKELCTNLPYSTAERATALRKLLEGKDAAVRAAMEQ